MRVLWFTNIVLPDMAAALGRTPEVVGGWMPALLDAIRETPSLQLGVAAQVPGGARGPVRVNGVTYYALPPEGHYLPLARRRVVAACADAVRSFVPDLVHVHGTEGIYAAFVASHACTMPSVVSIQGLLHACARHVRGGIALRQAVRLGSAGTLCWLRYTVQQGAWFVRGMAERRTLKKLRDVIGRTAWDEERVRSINPGTRYHHCGEVLRKQFFRHRWEYEKSRRHTIFCTAAHSPLKGFHVLLRAVALLRDEFPEVSVRVAAAPWNHKNGSGYYGRYVRHLIARERLSAHVVPLPAVSAEDVAAELEGAHAFVIPSFIENSPNSLAEAMLVGTPSVAALTGGIPSMIDDGATALGFAVGDPIHAADCIRRIFRDRRLAEELSANAQRVAVGRHSPSVVGPAQVRIYREILAAA